MSRKIDLTGMRFGKLLVIAEAKERASQREVQWICLCDCGKETIVRSSRLRKGLTQSCGCGVLEANIKHGKSSNKNPVRLYRIWKNMKRRCNNPNRSNYNRYGGRGIKVCQEWQEDFQAFYDWAMANGYQEDLEIDRIDNDGNYEPSNCRWVTHKENCNNRRTIK